jgi:hypothetical protein
MTISAWDIPGWTSQNPSYPPIIPVTTPLPVGVRRVTLSESYVGAAGAANGIVVMTPQTTRVEVDDVEVLVQQVRSQLKNGKLKIEILVPPTDAIVWQVREAIGPERLSYYVTVPPTAVDQELSALVHVDSDGQPITT